jgi:hypothetical protein
MGLIAWCSIISGSVGFRVYGFWLFCLDRIGFRFCWVARLGFVYVGVMICQIWVRFGAYLLFGSWEI